MAEPISLASGLLTLATFAFQSCTALVNAVQSYRHHPQHVRDLKNELEGLMGVLGSLTETIGAITDIDLSALDLPLLRCGNACAEFQQEITRCCSRSGADRTSFRDWAKLRYMGDNIDGFRHLISGYKSTIIIALTDASLRRTSVTIEGLDTYRDLIKDATDDLEAHLQSIDEKLETIFARAKDGSPSNAAELRLMQQERMSTQKCLEICAQLSNHIDRVQLTPEGNGPSLGAGAVPDGITTDGLQECKKSLSLTIAKLEGHMLNVMNQLVARSKAATSSAEEQAELSRLQEEWETTRQTRDIYAKADSHARENISNIDNYATGDAVQFMVSTDGRTIHGRNRGLGWRTRQVGGHLKDVTVQQLSRDFLGLTFPVAVGKDPSPRGDKEQLTTEAGHEERYDPEWRERHGPGFTLTSKIPDDTPASYMNSGKVKSGSSSKT